MNYSNVTERNGSFVDRRQSIYKTCVDQESLALAAAQIFVDQFAISLKRFNQMSVVLSGGSTPIRTYELLASEAFKNKVNWQLVHIFWGDERCVPITDSRSNFQEAHRVWLSKVPIPPQHIHPMYFAGSAHDSALDYEALLKRYFGNSKPCFDLIFLGLGEDGHTASLFPDSPLLDEQVRWICETRKQNENFDRMTMTLTLLNQAHFALFLVNGNEKSQILTQILQKKLMPHLKPAQLVNPISGDLVWLINSPPHELKTII